MNSKKNGFIQIFLTIMALLLSVVGQAYAAPGDLDTTFGTGGIVTTYDAYTASAVSLQPDGKIVIAGYYKSGSNNDFVVVRLNTDGTLDTTFGTEGNVITPIGSSSHDAARAVAIQSDGKIVAGGSSSTITSYSNGSPNYVSDFAVVRYNADGSLDTTFGTGGKVTTSTGSYDDFASALVLQPDGKIVAAGESNNSISFSPHFAVVRYNIDGTLDTTFNGTGKVITPVSSYMDGASDVSLQSDGKIVAAGNSHNNGIQSDFAVVRYNTDGSLDATFGSGGKVTTSIGNSNDEAQAVAIQSDGKIVAAGAFYDGSNYHIAIVRYNTDSSLDTTFGSGGKVTTYLGGNTDQVRSVVLQPDGKIIAAGSYDYPYGGDFAVVRYNTDGSLDTTFGTGGKVTTSVGNSYDAAMAVALQSDGNIVVAGGSSGAAAVVRYMGDTVTDTIPPTGSVSINGGATYTKSTTATLTLSCTDISGCAEMQFSNDNTTWSTLEAYAATKTWAMAAGDGTKTVYVKFKDNAGSTSATKNDTIVLDTTAPAAPAITSPADASSTTNQTPAISGTAETNSTVTVYDGATTLGTATVSGTGAWSYTTATLSVGAHSFTAKAADAAGNISAASSAVNITVIDTTPPDTTITAQPATLTKSTTADFSFTSTEAGSTFECQLDSGSYATCTTPKSYTGLADGSHTFYVRATDASANTDATPASFTWTVDTTPPDTTITAKPSDPSKDTSASFSFNSTETGSTFECQLDTSGYSACTSPKSYTTLGAGSHTYYVRATDAAANTDATPASFTWTVDATAPSITIAAVTTPTNATGQTITGTVEAGATVSVATDTAASDGAATVTGTTWSYAITGFVAGANNITVTAADAAGNTATATSSITLDTTTTVTINTVTTPTNATGQTITGTVEAGATVSVATDTAASDGAATVTGTTWSYAITGLVKGTNNITVTATDAAGNTATATSSIYYDTFGASPGNGNVDGTGYSITRVDGYDLIKLSIAFGSVPTDANWNPVLDLDKAGASNNKIDGADLITLGAHFGEVTP